MQARFEAGGIDPDQLTAGVDERAAGVAGIDRRIGLDEVLESGPAESAARRADDTHRHGLAKSESGCRSREPHRRYAAYPTGRSGWSGSLSRLISQHRELGQRVGANEAWHCDPAVRAAARGSATHPAMTCQIGDEHNRPRSINTPDPRLVTADVRRRPRRAPSAGCRCARCRYSRRRRCWRRRLRVARLVRGGRRAVDELGPDQHGDECECEADRDRLCDEGRDLDDPRSWREVLARGRRARLVAKAVRVCV